MPFGQKVAAALGIRHRCGSPSKYMGPIIRYHSWKLVGHHRKVTLTIAWL